MERQIESRSDYMHILNFEVEERKKHIIMHREGRAQERRKCSFVNMDQEGKGSQER